MRKAVAVGQANENSELNFSQCQFGAGAKSGGHSHSLGASLLLDKSTDNGGLICLDVANAYSETDRA